LGVTHVKPALGVTHVKPASDVTHVKLASRRHTHGYTRIILKNFSDTFQVGLGSLYTLVLYKKKNLPPNALNTTTRYTMCVRNTYLFPKYYYYW
jgi:hypothetical protein